MITKNGKIRCDLCGRFVANNDVTGSYTPDSDFTIERIEHYHKKCNEVMYNEISLTHHMTLPGWIGII